MLKEQSEYIGILRFNIW